MEGKIEATRCRGKQRRTWTSNVMVWCGMSYTKCVRVAESIKRAPWQSNFFKEDGTHSDSDNEPLRNLLIYKIGMIFVKQNH